MRFRVPSILVCAALAALPAVGCGDGHDHDHDHDHAPASAHAHAAPRGGVLVALGEHAANVEVVFDPAAGKLQAFLLDGCAEKPVRVKADGIAVALTTPAVELRLLPVASALTGETVGDTSAFEAADSRLVGLKSLDGTIREVTVAGTVFRDVAFRYAAK